MESKYESAIVPYVERLVRKSSSAVMKRRRGIIGGGLRYSLWFPEFDRCASSWNSLLFTLSRLAG
jgi:hypothetical protein